eukprot:jgi/Botrbrau1/9381/Bobra.0252s0007.1
MPFPRHQRLINVFRDSTVLVRVNTPCILIPQPALSTSRLFKLDGGVIVLGSLSTRCWVSLTS